MRHVCIVFFLIGEATSQKPIYPELYRPLSVGDAPTGKPVLQPRLFTPPRLPSLSPTPLPFSLFPFRRLPASLPPTLHEHSITPASSITKTGSSSASLPLPASFVLMWNRELLSLSSVGPYSYNSHLCIFFLQRTWEHTWRSQKQRRYLMVAKTEGCVMEFHACRVGESRWR